MLKLVATALLTALLLNSCGLAKSAASIPLRLIQSAGRTLR